MALPLPQRFRRAGPLVLVRIIFPGDTPLLPSLFQPCFIPANRLVSSSLSHTIDWGTLRWVRYPTDP